MVASKEAIITIPEEEIVVASKEAIITKDAHLIGEDRSIYKGMQYLPLNVRKPNHFSLKTCWLDLIRRKTTK